MIKIASRFFRWIKAHWRICVCVTGLVTILAGMFGGLAYHVHQHDVQQNRIYHAEHLARRYK